MKAMILAAGLGTRFKPWTDRHPKALALVNGKSLLERNIRYLQKFGIDEVLINVHHFSGQILNAIAEYKGWGSQITISDESDEVLETGGGLKKAAFYFDSDPFVMMNADILTDMDMNKMLLFHKEKSPLVTIAITDRKSSRYFLFDHNCQLTGWRNEKTGEEKIAIPNIGPREMAFSGIHVISPKILPLINRTGKFSIVEVYLELCSSYPILGYDHSGAKLVDVGRTESVVEAELLFP